MAAVHRPDDGELEFADYLRILRHRWIWVAASTAVVVALAVAFVATRPARYTATAQVSIGDSAAQEALQLGLTGGGSAAVRALSNEVNLALSDAVRTEVVDRLGYEPSVAVDGEDSADVIRFTATAEEAATAAVDANTWAQVYVDTKRQQASDSIDEAIGAFSEDLADLRQQRQTLRQPLDDVEDRLVAVAVDDVERVAQLEAERGRLQADLEPELALIDARVEAVAQSITNLELSRRLAATGTARVVQVAAPPQQAATASLGRTLTLAAVVGLVLGAAAALLADNLDRTITGPDDLGIGLPSLGEIPLPDRQLPAAELPLATMRHSGSQVAEAYQKVRTAVEFALLGREIGSLLITSPNASEGKTTTAVNLAWAMSAVDHRVALIDVDLRRPAVHRVFDCDQRPGLSDHLLSGLSLDQLALRVDEDGSSNLIVIPAGSQPPSPANFVASPAFTSVIRGIEDEADLVLLDGPPVLPVSDSLSLARQVDAVIVTVRAGSTTRDELADCLDSLRQVGADVIGVCVVGVRTTSYGHGYADDVDRRRSRSRRRAPADHRRAPADTEWPELDLRDLPDRAPRGPADLDPYRS